MLDAWQLPSIANALGGRSSRMGGGEESRRQLTCQPSIQQRVVAARARHPDRGCRAKPEPNGLRGFVVQPQRCLLELVALAPRKPHHSRRLVFAAIQTFLVCTFASRSLLSLWLMVQYSRLPGDMACHWWT